MPTGEQKIGARGEQPCGLASRAGAASFGLGAKGAGSGRKPMKQVRFGAFGTPEDVAECVEVDDVGAPGPEEVVIEIQAFPINPADLLTITGAYAVRPRLPATLGAESVGRISAVGSEVTQVAAGDR